MKAVKQQTASDCGPACLRFIARFYGRRIANEKLRIFAGTDTKGTSLQGLLDAANDIGFRSRAVRCPVQALPTLPTPSILLVRLASGNEHFVVLWRKRRKTVTLMDPARGAFVSTTHADAMARWSGVMIIVAPNLSADVPQVLGMPTWRRLIGMLKPHKGVLFELLLGAIVCTAVVLSTSIFVRLIIDRVVPTGNSQMLNVAALAMVLFLLARFGLTIAQARLSARIGTAIDVALILGYYRHLLKLPQTTIETLRVGELTARISDAAKLRSYLSEALSKFLANLLIIPMGLIGLLLISPRLTLYALGALPLVIGLIYLGARYSRGYHKEAVEGSSAFNASLTETLIAIGTIKRLGLDHVIYERAERLFVKMQKAMLTALSASVFATNASDVLTRILTVAFLWAGTSLILNTEITAGELMSSYTLIAFMTGPVVGLVGFWTSSEQMFTSAERLFSIIDLGTEKDEGRFEVPTKPLTEGISLSNVSFGFAGRQPCLREISLQLAPGRIHAIIGPSGCGKSTLLNLLQRMLEPTDGSLALEGCETKNFQLRNYRAAFSVVPQKIDLFSGSILENVCLGATKWDILRVSKLCKDIGLLDMIERLPNGFNTMVREGGANFSGGQRQRLAIVRMLYQDTPIVLLDEPSSALDESATQLLREILLTLRGRGKLIVLVTHDPAFLEIADQTIVLKDGRGTQNAANDIAGRADELRTPLPLGGLLSHANPIGT